MGCGRSSGRSPEVRIRPELKLAIYLNMSELSTRNVEDFRCSLLESCRTSSVQSEMLCPDAHASPWIGTATSYIVIPLVSYTRRTAPSSLVLMLYTKSLNWNLPVTVFFTFIQRALKFGKKYHTILAVQSAGGYAMRQKLGAGRVNSTATLVGPDMIATTANSVSKSVKFTA